MDLPERYQVSIVLGTYNRLEELKKLLEQIEKLAVKDHEVVVIDGGSTDGTIEFLSERAKQFDNLTVVLDKNRDDNKNMKRTLQECYNMGFKLATGRYIIHMNDDCQIGEQETPWLQKSIEFMESEGNEEIGMLALQIGEYDSEGKLNFRFSYDDILGSNLLFANHGLIQRKTFERLGWWDDGFMFYAADNDFALTVRDNQMHVVGFEEADQIIHTATQDEAREVNEQTAKFDFARLKEKWGAKLGTLVQQEMQKPGKFRSVKQSEISDLQVTTIKPDEGE